MTGLNGAVGAAGLLGLWYAVLAARELAARTRIPGWAYAVLLVPAALAAAWLLGRRPGTLSFTTDGRAGWVSAGLVALGLGVVLLGRANGIPDRAATLLGLALIAVAAVTWVPLAGAPHWGSPDTARWAECFTARYRWDVYSQFDSSFDAVPNLALYAPLGAALIWAWRRRRALAPLAALSLSLATESYQALVTDRECAASDVLVNLNGALLGMVLVVALEVLAPPRR